jgi:hypothetical protein
MMLQRRTRRRREESCKPSGLHDMRDSIAALRQKQLEEHLHALVILSTHGHVLALSFPVKGRD